METVLILLAGILMGAFNVTFFCLGYYVRSKKPMDDGLTVSENNKEFIEEMMQWKNFKGGN